MALRGCESCGPLPRKAANGVGAAQEKEVSDMETQSLEFALLGFGLALVQHVLTTPSFLPLEVEICFL